MKNLSTLLFAAAVICLASCSEGENTKYRKAENAVEAPANTAPASKPIQPTTTPAQTATPATGVAINPPHGQPNHRCDIPEGAPLNTPMQPNLKAAAPQFKPQPQGQGAVAPGTNPPHGQPGHDCAIPVGAPLNK